jgi:hypothetical protein
VQQILQQLREYDLYIKLEKCSFDYKQVEFLGYISSEGICTDPTKVQIVLDWQTPGSVREVQCSLGFASFYCKFIKSYSSIILPLIQLTQKN